jgi:hypothetical protein
MMNGERFATLLEPYLFRVYEEVIERGEDYVGRLFGTSTSKKAWEKVSGIGAADMPVEWQGQVHYGDVSPLWDKTFTHAKYSTGLKFERELWDDALYPEVKNRVNSVMLAVHRFRQIHAHYPFNNAFGDYKTPDGVALCATNHPSSPENATTQSNKGTSALSVDSLEETRTAMLNFKDDKGKKLLVVPDLLIVPPSLEQKAKEIVLSTGRPDTADRVDNVRRNAYDVLTLPLLEDSNNWYLVDSKRMKQYQLWFDRRLPVPEREQNQTEDFDTEVIKFKQVMRFSYGSIHWTWVYGHQVA